MKDIQNYSLLNHNTFGIDVKCQRFLEYSQSLEALQVAKILRGSSLPYIIIGGGSNLLLTRDFDGIVVHSACKGIDFDDDVICCGSGESWDNVVAQSIQHQLYGLENLSLIPGDVGASAVQNIGAYGVEAKDFITQIFAVEISSGNIVVISHEECAYGYRDSRFKHEWKNQYLILQVVYQLQTTFTPRIDYGNICSELQRQGILQPTAQQVRQTIIDIRNEKLPDPKVLGNAGSFFMNPVVSRSKFEKLLAEYPQIPHYDIDTDRVKIPAGWLIEQSGWKGRSLGHAAVHDKQALVLVNLGGATGQEIVALCQAIRKDVKDKFEIEISPEVNII